MGYTVNVPLTYGVGDAGFQSIFDEILYPIAIRFQPEIILVSAGFDAHWNDPLASLNLSLIGYAHICHTLYTMANELCDGRLIYTLEGGYHLNVLAHAVANTFRVLLELPESQFTDPLGPSPNDESSVEELVRQLRVFHDIA